MDINDNTMASAKCRRIIKMMNICDGCKIHASRVLGCDPQTLRRWIKDFRIDGADMSGMRERKRGMV